MIQSFSPVGGSVGSRIRPSGHGSSSFGRFGRFGRRLGGPSRPCLSLSLARASFSDEQSDHEDVDHEPAFFYDEYRTNEHLKDWRTFRAMMVASEHGLGDGGALSSRRDALRRLFTMNHSASTLGKHVGSDSSSTTTPSASTPSTSVWSHTITSPERGCLLVAKRPDLGMFSYSVVLMTEHDDEIGSSGLVLNMATPLHVSNLGLEDHISQSLGKLPLYIGGPVTRNLLHVLHGVGEVEGSMEIVPGVYAGGVESAAELVLRGELEAGEFRLLAGYSGWEPYQLSEEIRHGAWHVISASSDVILGCIKGDFTGFSHALDDRDEADGEGWMYGMIGHDLGVDTKKLNCWKAILSETMFGEV